MKARYGLALSGSSALLLFAAGEPLGWGLLAWLAMIPLAVAVSKAASARAAALFGFVFGLVFFAVHIAWIFVLGWMAWAALSAFLSLYIATGMFVAGLLRKSSLAPLWFAGAWTGAELLRDRWPYGGYSWGAVGTTQGTVPGVRFLAGTVGVYGLSFLVVLFAALVAHRIATDKIEWRSVAIVAAVLAVFVAVDLASSKPPSKPLRLAVVQGSVPRPPTYDQRDRIFESHLDLTTRLLARQHADLVVWPEDSIGVGVSAGAIETVQALAKRTHTPFVVGQSVVAPPGERFLNLVDYIDANGRTAGSYQKRHPVPFGEYVPIGFFRRFVGTLRDEVPLDQEPGKRALPLDIKGDRIATPICFESVFPRDFLDFERNGAELFILETNNASFEHTYMGQQHLAHTRMRALETRQWVVQAALAGISAQIDPDGTVHHATQLFHPTSFIADVRVRGTSSLYARTGDVFAMLFAALTALAVLVLLRRRRLESES